MEERELSREEQKKIKEAQLKAERDYRKSQQAKLQEQARLREISRQEREKLRERNRLEREKKAEAEWQKKLKEQDKKLKDLANLVITTKLSKPEKNKVKGFMAECEMTEAYEFRDIAMECIAEMLELSVEMKLQYDIFLKKHDNDSANKLVALVSNIKESSNFTLTAIKTYFEMASLLQNVKPYKSRSTRRTLN